MAIAGYIIYRNGVRVGTSFSNSYVDATAVPGVQYSYTVVAFNDSGDVSAPCAPVFATAPMLVTMPGFLLTVAAGALAKAEIKPLTGVSLTTTAGVITPSIVAGGGTATPTYIQQGTFTSAGPATMAAAFGAPVASGNAVFGCCSWDNHLGAAITSITDDKGNVYTICDNINDSAHTQSAASFCLGNITNAPQTITVNCSATIAGALSIAINEYSNITPATDPRDGHIGALQAPPGTVANAITSGNVTTTADGDLLWGAVAQTQGQAVATAGTNFTVRSSLNGAAAFASLATEERVQSPHAAAPATFTQSVNGNTVCFVIAAKAKVTAPPVVTNASFSFGVAATTGQGVGTITATNSPTSWSITGVSGGGAATSWFAIDNSGAITVTATGAANLTAGTAGTVYTITCQASNAAGSNSGTATCTATAIVAANLLIGGQTGPGVSFTLNNATDAGFLIGAIAVTTNVTGTYVGTITISGTDGSKFSLSASSNVSSAAYPCNLYVSQTNLAAGTYAITLTANP